MPQLDTTVFAPQLVWLAITFIALYAMLSIFVLPKIGGVLRERKRRMDDDLMQAAKMRDASAKLFENYETALAQARAQALEITQAAVQLVRGATAEQEAELDLKFKAQFEEAEKRLIISRDEALNSVRDVAVGLVANIVEAALGSKVTKDAVKKSIASTASQIEDA